MVIKCHQTNAQGASAGLGNVSFLERAVFILIWTYQGSFKKQGFFQAAENEVHKTT